MKAMISKLIGNNPAGVEVNFHQMVKACKALSEPIRVRMLLLLLHRECCVFEVELVLGISQTRTSRSLKALHEAGFLKLKKVGLWSHYSVDLEGMPPSLHRMIEAGRVRLEGNQIITEDRQRLEKMKNKTAT
jgi:DNA-binding transcriptional ArsR family regulator